MSKQLAEKLILPEDRIEFEPLEANEGRFSFFKALFAKSGKMAKINVFAILFALPTIIWFLRAYLLRTTYDIAINYSGNIGLGFSMVENAVQEGNIARFLSTLQNFAILVPFILIMFVGIGGAFYAMRMLAQGDERITKNFFKGIKLTVGDFFLHGLIAGLVVFVFAVNFCIYDAYGVHLAWKIVGIIGASLLVLFALCYLMYATTISTFYKSNLRATIKNSMLFIRHLPLQTIVFSVVGAVPFVVLYFSLPGLFLNNGNMGLMLITTVGVSLFLFLGISFIVAAWTVYTDYIYELGFGALKTMLKSEKKKQSKNAKNVG